ncbi:hypothetical protein [Clostridium novyi]|uniref:hypothetical protein n=1 Tax=Clostridium novyi TaxID=1542 RepID=UPI0004D75629|nr:hypothetical protein [Clostridium novyi]KEI08022.1 hypothetical protein Z958_p0097 [Clostridium novyi B str. NCTC 9691]KEI12755.1 hypothetical protein Z958_05605 [Clostridium novyi B str. NCTC 9691]
MDIRINIERFYKDRIYKEKLENKLQYAVFLLKEERASYTFINQLAFQIIDAVYNKDLEFLKEFRNKKIAFGYSCIPSKCIDLIFK